MQAQLEAFVRENLGRMTMWKGFGDQSSTFIERAVGATLDKQWARASEQAMVVELYHDDSRAARQALHTLAMHVRQTYLPRWYAGPGWMDEARIRFPERSERQRQMPAYLPVIDPAFGCLVCREYDARHSIRRRGADHPLAVSAGSEGDQVPVPGWLIRKGHRNLLVLPQSSNVMLADTLIPLLVQSLPVPTSSPAGPLHLRPRFLDCSVLSLEHIWLAADQHLVVTSKGREELLLAWTYAENLHRRMPKSISAIDMFFQIAPADLDDLVPPPSKSFEVDKLLIVDDSHARLNDVARQHLLAELTRALVPRTIEGPAGRPKELLTAELIRRLVGRVQRVGQINLWDALSVDSTPTPDTAVQNQIVLRQWADGSITVSVWNAKTKRYSIARLGPADKSFARMQRITAAITNR